MTVIISSVPGVSDREILDALRDINPGVKVTTGHGGFVVDERTAYEFLRAYLVVTSQLPATGPEPEPEPEHAPPATGPDTIEATSEPEPELTPAVAPKRQYRRRGAS